MGVMACSSWRGMTQLPKQISSQDPKIKNFFSSVEKCKIERLKIPKIGLPPLKIPNSSKKLIVKNRKSLNQNSLTLFTESTKFSKKKSSFFL
jgi:hypothetical protein